MLFPVFKTDRFIWLLACLVLPPISYSEPSHQDDHGHTSQQETHLHGVSNLMLALDKGKLEVRIESPAANLVGFEHMARDREQINLLNEAKAILSSPERLFLFSGGDCDLTMSKVDISSLLHESHTKHEEHDEKSHFSHSGHHDSHDKHGDRDGRSDKAHKHHHEIHNDSRGDHHVEDDETHNEITAEYKFTCKRADTLSAVQVDLIKQFPGIEKLKVYWLNENKQGTITLSANASMINIR